MENQGINEKVWLVGGDIAFTCLVSLKICGVVERSLNDRQWAGVAFLFNLTKRGCGSLSFM